MRVKNDRDVFSSWYIRVPAYAVFSLIFFFKMRREGDCRFEFSPEFVRRTSKTGESINSWTDLGAVWQIPGAYIIVGKTHGMAPVPWRCLTEQQRSAIQTWAGTKFEPKLLSNH